MSAERNDGGPAHPTHWQDECPGMSLRDYFAGQALAGYLASFAGLSSDPDREASAIKAFAYADAMLAARKGGAA